MNREAWSETRLKYATKVNLAVLPESTSPDTVFKYIDIGNVSQGAMDSDVASIRFADAPSRARRIAEPGDTVVSTVRTYLRAVAPVPESSDPLVFSTGFAVLRPVASIVPRYLSWYLQGDDFISRVEASSVGVSYPAITATQLATLSLPLPPFDEQHAIADYLDRETQRIDELIAEQRGLIETLRERRVAVIRAGVSGVQYGGHITPTDDWYGSLPDGWSAAPIGYDFSVVLGKMLNARKATSDCFVEAPYLTAGSIQPFALTIDEPKSMAFSESELAKYSLKRGDVVVVEGGAGYGRSQYLTEDLEGWGFQNHVARIRATTGLVLGRFVNYCVKACLASGYVEANNRTATLPSLSRDVLSAISIPRPPSDVQKSICDEIDYQTSRIDALIAESEELIALSLERRAALITAAVTGQIDVRTAV